MPIADSGERCAQCHQEYKEDPHVFDACFFALSSVSAQRNFLRGELRRRADPEGRLDRGL